MSMRVVIVLVAALVVLFFVSQAVAIALQTNPPVTAEPPWNGPETRALAKRACFDCHSNETVWPIYARLTPAAWLLLMDVRQARGKLNLSEWQSGPAWQGGAGARAVASVIADGVMPPSRYLMLHPEARLSDAEKQQLMQGIIASLK